MSPGDLERCGLDLSKLTALKLQGYDVIQTENWTILQYHGHAIASYNPFLNLPGWDLYIGIQPSFAFHLDTLRKILGTIDGVF